jgi:hypothetical protein
MEVVSGEGEDDDGDPAMTLLGPKQHLSFSCSQDLFSVSLFSDSALASQDCPASSKHIGHHLNKVEDILRNHQGVGQHGGCNGVIDGVSLLLDTLWVSFTDRQPIFCASSQPHGHLGRQAADHEGELGRQGEAVLVNGAVGSMVWVWGVTGGGALAGFHPASVSASAGSEQTDFQAFYTFLGHSGSLVSGEPVGEHWMEDTGGSWAWVEVTAVGGVNFGVGQGVKVCECDSG